MNRREFIAVLVGAAIAGPARAQQASMPPKACENAHFAAMQRFSRTWGEVDINWQAKSADSVENDPNRKSNIAVRRSALSDRLDQQQLSS